MEWETIKSKKTRLLVTRSKTFLNYPLLLLILLSTVFLSTACQTHQNRLVDGYYTVKSDAYDANGWQEFLVIGITNGLINSVDFDAENDSGFIRSWDVDYMRRTTSRTNTRPTKVVRNYEYFLINFQDPNRIQAQWGARRMHEVFSFLAKEAILKAEKGDTTVTSIKLPTLEYIDDI
jgi:major membrane immunogen (membrane-anchored lipoprotein)